MPTENRSSNTEMVSVPREHELKIRQTPLADLLSGLKTGEVRDCSDREFAVGDTVLLREIDDARDYTGTVLRRTITHVQKHYGLPEHLCVLSYGQPAQQPHPEPIAWMVGTAFWWTKEEAEKDAAATGLPIVGLGPMGGIEPAEQNKGEPVGALLIGEYFDNREVGEVDVQLDHKVCEQLAEKYPGQSLPLYTRADPGEAERLSKATAFVQRLVDCSGIQPSVATGYLRDILDELKGNTTPTAPVERDERAAFEHHHRICDLVRDEDCQDYYRNQSVQDSWEGWQARADQEIRP
ncbi:DUF3850 domain-containing protein [Pseudomonas sp. zjy_14]|uniref:DUF3850 domain-containing protein n=1 Tax=Pseudomonas sp. zjy_14 TaxID=3367264 RepID=UPI00370B9A2A